MSDDTSFSSCDQSNDCPPSYNTLENLPYNASDSFCNTASEPTPHNPSDHILSPLPACFPDVHQSTNHFSTPSDPNYDIEAASHIISASNTTNLALSALHSNATEFERSKHISAAEALHDTRTTPTTSRQRRKPSARGKCLTILIMILVIIIIGLAILYFEAEKRRKDGEGQGGNAGGRLRDDWDDGNDSNDWNASINPVGGLRRGTWGV
ncbi:hypothetical protein BKA58DRAFT_389764 [Alternaria rosae]|uniref:uncharacterized protein n=1 Tax=Alternaria rosae TaxID=1187941 RepID=UPI001E8EB090|nr:uncharacterized protein BKA58DRAFT_389764 [Alternaria rosae]KAH6865584.1 hypothetical protein BKA58DRAFT_389764 [Alternaria rosae]